MLLDIVGTTALSDWSLCLLHLEASSPNFFKRARKTLARASVRWCIRAAFWHKNRTWSKSIQIQLASAMIIPTNFPQTWQFGFITASWTGKNRARLIARHLRFCDHVWKNLSKLRLKKQEDSWQVRIASPQILQSLCQNWCFHFANPGASYFLRTCCLCTSARSELSGKSMPSPSVSAKYPHFGIWDSHGFPWIPMDSHGWETPVSIVQLQLPAGKFRWAAKIIKSHDWLPTSFCTWIAEPPGRNGKTELWRHLSRRGTRGMVRDFVNSW